MNLENDNYIQKEERADHLFTEMARLWTAIEMQN